MKPQDLKIEELTVGTYLVLAWGRVLEYPFQFRAKHGSWTFAVFQEASVQPWDLDLPGPRQAGMCIVHPKDAAEMSEAEARRIVMRCAEAYLYMTGRRRSDLSSEGRTDEDVTVDVATGGNR